MPLKTKTNAPVCGNRARAMLFDWAMRHFAYTPAKKPAPQGAMCPICGSTDAQLYVNADKSLVCEAQMAITAKRPGRDSADKPAVPATGDERGHGFFGDGHIVVAGPLGATVITKVLPTEALPEGLDLGFPAGGDQRRVLRELVLNPPPPPFTVAFFSQKADWNAEVTVDTSRIVVNGPEPIVIDRGFILDLINICGDMSASEFGKVIRLRERVAIGASPDEEADMDVLRTLTERYPSMRGQIHRLPSPGSADARILDIILSTATK